MNPSSVPVVSASGLSKTYTFHEQQAGMLGALGSLIRRRYQSRLAVAELSFDIQPGEVVGLLGRNGAGKTTTLKMLAGLLRPSTGHLEVLGFRPATRRFEFLRRVAVVLGQKTMLWWDVPTMDSLLVHKAMYAMSRQEFASSVDELAALLDVEALLHVPVRKLSLGQRMRCELLLALLHRPDLLFLDEPTIGLDVVAKATVRRFLGELNQLRQTTILLTSHDMDDVEALCPRVLLIDDGRLRYDGLLSGLVRATRPQKRVRVTFARPVETPAVLPEGAELVEASDGTVLTVDVSRSSLPDLLAVVPTWGPLVDLDVRDPDVEEIMRDLLAGKSPSPVAP